MLKVMVVGAASVLIGCGSPTSTVPSTAPAAPDSSVDGPVVRQQRPFSDEGLAALMEGDLQLDGDCLYVEQASGDLRYPLLWPAATTWDDTAQAVVLADGRVLPLGSIVSAGGGYISVDDLGRLLDDRATEALAACALPPYGEVAVINNDPGAVSRPLDG